MTSTDINKAETETAVFGPPKSFGFLAFCAGFVIAFLVATAAWFGAIWWTVAKIWSWF